MPYTSVGAMVQGTGTQYLWRPLRGGQNDEDDGEYERERREKLKKNQEMLAQFGIVDLKNEMAAMKKVKHVRRRPRDLASKNLEPVRRSSRMTRTQVRYAESSEEEKARHNDDSSVEMSSGMDEDSEVLPKRLRLYYSFDLVGLLPLEGFLFFAHTWL